MPLHKSLLSQLTYFIQSVVLSAVENKSSFGFTLYICVFWLSGWGRHRRPQISTEATKRNRKCPTGTQKSDSRQTTAEFNANLPKIIQTCRATNPLSTGNSILSLLAVGILPVSTSATTAAAAASTPDSSYIPGGPRISTSDSGCDTHNVINDLPEPNRRQRAT